MELKDRFFQKILFIDTAPLIYFIEGHSDYNEKLSELFKSNENGDIYFQTSTLTLLEVLVQPLRHQKLELARQYENILTTSSNLEIFDIDIQISIQAAQLRADYNIKTPDSIQIATGIDKNADFFITNDKKLKNIDKIKVLTLEEI